MMKHFTAVLTFLSLLWAVDIVAAEPKDSAAPKDSSATPKVGLYEKTFVKVKDCRTESCEGGFLKLHLAGEKLYVEMDKQALGRRMLISSTVTAVSDPETVPVGHKPIKPLYVRFVQPDSLTVNLCQITPLPEYDINDAALVKAVERTTLDTVFETFKVFCESPDKSAVVFDATSLFKGDDSRLGPVKSGTSNLVTTKYTFKKGSDHIDGFKVFKDNVSICTSLTYSVSSDMLGLVTLKKDEPFTLKTTRTILMLPEEKMQPRKADTRIGIFLTTKRVLSSDRDEIVKRSVIHRWRLEPSDTAAYLRGEKVLPVKHIVFYLDDAFPAEWRDAAARGVLRWNSAFEDIGFKDVIQVKDFPDDDPEFDPDNLKYSCIRYVPSTVANAMGPSWVDPESGEIINASVILYNDVVKLASEWRFCQTAQLDPRAREKRMPSDLMAETMEYVVAHEVGHCLGFMHNMAASAAFPSDSLRSASFTRKYGTTASIMDYARFNYVAQPSDEGVALDPPFLGDYDRFLVKYSYSFIPENADATVERWVDEKAGNPVYRYGRQQISGRYDPSAIEEDLGDNPIRSSDYGTENLKYILAHFDEWMPDSVDPDGTLRQTRYNALAKQYSRYLNAVMLNVGGIYITPHKASADLDAVVPVPAQVQRESLEWVIGQLKNIGWLSGMTLCGNAALALDKADVLLFNTASDLFSGWENVILSSYYAGEDGYGLEDWIGDIHRMLWKSKKPGKEEMVMQKVYVAALVSAATKKTSISKVSMLAGEDQEFEFGPAGYNWQSKVNIKPINNSKELFLAELVSLRKIAASRARGCSDKALKGHWMSIVREIDAVSRNNI